MPKLKSVEIRDIMGIENLRFDAGAVTVISGGNSVGKSSILQAIATVFHGGHDPAMIRHGADKGTITLTLDDGTVIRKYISQKGYEVSAKTSKGTPIRPPKEFIDKLASGFGFDPVAMMDAKKPQRLKFFLDVLPIEFTAAELAKILPSDRAPVKSCSLPELEDIRAGVYDERKALNQSVKALEGSIKTMADGLPAIDDAIDWVAEAKQFADQLADQKWQLAANEKDLETQKERLKGEKRAEAQTKIDAIKTELAAEEQRIDEQAAKVFKEGAVELQRQIDDTTGELATAQEKAAAIERATGARKLLDEQRDQCRKKFLEAEEFSGMLKAIDKLKIAKLSTLPIQGLDLVDGDIHVDKVPWEKVNTSDLWLTVIQMAALATGNLPILICDHAEHLEGKRWHEILPAIKKSGVQVITARVTKGILRVESVEEFEARQAMELQAIAHNKLSLQEFPDAG